MPQKGSKTKMTNCYWPQPNGANHIPSGQQKRGKIQLIRMDPLKGSFVWKSNRSRISRVRQKKVPMESPPTFNRSETKRTEWYLCILGKCAKILQEVRKNTEKNHSRQQIQISIVIKIMHSGIRLCEHKSQAYYKKTTARLCTSYLPCKEEPRWWRNRTGRPLSPLQIHQKNWTLRKLHKVTYVYLCAFSMCVKRW